MGFAGHDGDVSGLVQKKKKQKKNKEKMRQPRRLLFLCQAFQKELRLEIRG